MTNETSLDIDFIQDQTSFLELQNGKIITQIIVHPAVRTSSFQVRVAGDYSSVPVNAIYQLYDDDDYGVVAPPLPRLDLVNDFMKSLFRPAFVELIDSGGFNLEKIVPFKLNDDLQWQTLVNSKKDLTETDALWVAPITAAYQFDSSEDGDPKFEEPTQGAERSFGDYGHATVFIECCREPYDNSFRIVNEQGGNPQTGIDALRNFKEQVTAQSAHEIGHLPRINALDQHLELGLMREGGSFPFTPEQSKFSPMTISRFRQTKKWSKR